MALARRDTEREAGTEQERGKDLYQYLWGVLIVGLQGQLQRSIGVSDQISLIRRFSAVPRCWQ